MKKRLGDILIDFGVIDESQLKRALKRQQQLSTRLGEVLIRMGLPMWDVEAALAEQRRSLINVPPDLKGRSEAPREISQ